MLVGIGLFTITIGSKQIVNIYFGHPNQMLNYQFELDQVSKQMCKIWIIEHDWP